MEIKISPIYLESGPIKVEALHYLPSELRHPNAKAALTHGYTSSKNDLLLWAERLAYEGIETILFDLPGHYLGSFNEVSSILEFDQFAPDLFTAAYNHLKRPEKFIIAGHSLGAKIILKYLGKTHLAPENLIPLLVGAGLTKENHLNLFTNPIYKGMLQVREQYVSQNLSSKIMAKYITEFQKDLNLSNFELAIITGEDDAVVPMALTQELSDQLTKRGNKVTLITPSSLPHHLPQKAITFMRTYILSKLNS